MTVTHGLDNRIRIAIGGLAYAGIVAFVGLGLLGSASTLVQGIVIGLAAWCGIAFIVALGLSRAAALTDYEEIATADPLTGLPDERSFRVEASRLLDGAPDGKIAVVLFETQGLTGLNTRCGRRAGDELIKEASRMISEASDGLGQPCHLGGGRFAVIVGQDDTSGTFQVLRLVQSGPIQLESCGHTHPLRLPAGFASSKAGEDLAGLMARAERRLLATKRRETGDSTGIARAS
jgi:diguanylate cyclase (GGDEF)-like protein